MKKHIIFKLVNILLFVSPAVFLPADDSVYRVTNYTPMEIDLIEADRIELTCRSINDPYLRCYSAWLSEDGGATYISLNGGCGPDEWKSSHCSCPTISGTRTITYDLSKSVETPFTGTFIFLISSYVGYWEVSARTVETAERNGAEAVPRTGWDWSTGTGEADSFTGIRNLQFSEEPGVLVLRGELTTWSGRDCPNCNKQIVFISDQSTGGLRDAFRIDMGKPGPYPGRMEPLRLKFPSVSDHITIWVIEYSLDNPENALSLARQDFNEIKKQYEPIITYMY